jgi:hypothetical protein
VTARLVDPGVQALLDEADMLPECAARDAVLRRAASRAETLNDLDTAWAARCRILSSSPAAVAPRFETLFLSLAWCLAVSDSDPRRFPATSVLWQYKWVATAAPKYASVPRAVLERLIDDMDARFAAEGWGHRAGLHKRLELCRALGEIESAKELVGRWRSTRRDRGADCMACEADSIADLLVALGEDEQAVREARAIVLGRLCCATVPHSTFGLLLLPLTRLGRHAEARDLYERGCRLVAALESGGALYSAPYLAYAGWIGDVARAHAILRARLPQAAALPSDTDRLRWFGWAGVGLEFLARRGTEELELPRVVGLTDGGTASVVALSRACRVVADRHAEALDHRNGNTMNATWLDTLGISFGLPPS